MPRYTVTLNETAMQKAWLASRPTPNRQTEYYAIFPSEEEAKADPVVRVGKWLVAPIPLVGWHALCASDAELADLANWPRSRLVVVLVVAHRRRSPRETTGVE